MCMPLGNNSNDLFLSSIVSSVRGEGAQIYHPRNFWKLCCFMSSSSYRIAWSPSLHKKWHFFVMYYYYYLKVTAGWFAGWGWCPGLWKEGRENGGWIGMDKMYTLSPTFYCCMHYDVTIVLFSLSNFSKKCKCILLI